MSRLLTLITSLLLIAVSGCIDFGNDIETTTPTAEQVNLCIKEMYLNPSLEITPLGFKLTAGGMDDAIWFKFKLTSCDISQIFDMTFVDISKFDDEFRFVHYANDLTWWDVNDKKLTGGKVTLPKARVLNVGIEKGQNDCIVYIFWHET